MAARAWTKDALSDTPSAAIPGDLSGVDDALADARAFGIDPSVASAALEAGRVVQLDGVPYEGIFETNLKALRAFVGSCNQWRMAGLQFLSIDYGAARAAWEAMELKLSADDFGKFQIIEAEAARLLNGGAA